MSSLWRREYTAVADRRAYPSEKWLGNFSLIEVSVTPGSLFQQRNYGLDRWKIASNSGLREGQLRNRAYGIDTQAYLYTCNVRIRGTNVRDACTESNVAVMSLYLSRTHLAVSRNRSGSARVPNTGTRASRSWKSIVLCARYNVSRMYILAKKIHAILQSAAKDAIVASSLRDIFEKDQLQNVWITTMLDRCTRQVYSKIKMENVFNEN